MQLLVLILIASICYTLYDIFAAEAANHIDANLSSIIFNGLGALLPLVVYAYYKFSKASNVIPATRTGIAYSVLAGISIALFSVVLIKVFEKGDIAYALPLIYGGSIVLASLVGWLILKEQVSLLQSAGIAVIAAGIGMVVASKA